MLSRCPYLECAATFDTPEGKPLRRGSCPKCAALISFHPVEHWLAIEKRIAQEHLPKHGGPTLNGSQPAMVAILEDVRSLWNVGSMFRTADGAGFGKLYLCGITGSPPRREIAKTSLGAEESVAWQYCRSALDLLPELKERGVTIVGLERLSEASVSSTPGDRCLSLSAAIEGGKLRQPVCLAVGNEVSGLSAEILSHCDLICDLPMRGIKESLNVAVAFGIAAYMIAGQSSHSP
jgi:tRNA G18 (ribose-2'-O)-methylase SpoU